ncbi:hypothetical protein NDU88_007799 [Pleurodeles waltl]|uniref:Uncharacterized protein n=1 Tax=Pleurodeles waltl TaxID=8319 RepID=A0AAV7STC2_PLEWA|nr:hypothetical protein NDU88_007799 [Pleurodeles waltl]
MIVGPLVWMRRRINSTHTVHLHRHKGTPVVLHAPQHTSEEAFMAQTQASIGTALVVRRRQQRILGRGRPRRRPRPVAQAKTRCAGQDPLRRPRPVVQAIPPVHKLLTPSRCLKA